MKGHVLDIGCGNGKMPGYLQDKSDAYISGFKEVKKIEDYVYRASFDSFADLKAEDKIEELYIEGETYIDYISGVEFPELSSDAYAVIYAPGIRFSELPDVVRKSGLLLPKGEYMSELSYFLGYADDMILPVYCMVIYEGGEISEYCFSDYRRDSYENPMDIGEALKNNTYDSLWEHVTDLYGRDRILAFAEDDYDGDGSFEAFATIINESDYYDSVWNCDIIYLKGSSSETVESEIPLCVNQTEILDRFEEQKIIAAPASSYVLDMGTYKYYMGEKAYAVANTLLLYGVQKGEFRKEAISDRGECDKGSIEKIKKGDKDFCLYATETDNILDTDYSIMSGRTYKPYYFYWDDGFYEYGGIEITMEDFLYFTGASEICYDIINSGMEIRNIIYRSNGIININCYSADYSGDSIYYTNYIKTLRADNNTVSDISGGYGSGVYRNALIPEIAVYPGE